MSRPRGEGPFRSFASVLRPVADILADGPSGGGAQLAFEESRKLGYNDGFEQGRAEGRATGLRDAELETEALRSELQKTSADAVMALDAELSQWRSDAEARLGRLSVAIARKVLAHEVETSQDTVSDIVRETLTAAIGTEVLKVRVPPGHIEALTASQASPIGIAIVADPSLEAGCVVETSWGELDGQVSTFLDRLETEAA